MAYSSKAYFMRKTGFICLAQLSLDPSSQMADHGINVMADIPEQQ